VAGYEVLRLIGRGGMGDVFLARQHALNRLVCIKVLVPSESEDTDISRSRFSREAELLASVSHPNVLAVYDHGTTVDTKLPFLVTEYIERGDLRRRLSASRGEPLPIEEAIEILRQVSAALICLHSHDILHRDLKPENILLQSETWIKVGDFGIAVLRGHVGSLTGSSRGLGTVGYVSPEQQYGLPIDERSDQYSLSALAYELLTGRRPLGAFAAPSHLNKRLNPELDAVVLRGLSESPGDRFEDVSGWLAALEAAVTARKAGRRPRLVLAASLGLAALAAVAIGLSTVSLGDGWGDLRVSEPRDLDGRRNPEQAQGQGGPERSPSLPAFSGVGIEASVDAGSRSGGNETSDVKTNSAKPGKPTRHDRLVELWAYCLWLRQGRPTGAEGEAVSGPNRVEAGRLVQAELERRAYQIWIDRGQPEGEKAKEENWYRAEIELLRETERAIEEGRDALPLPGAPASQSASDPVSDQPKRPGPIVPTAGAASRPQNASPASNRSPTEDSVWMSPSKND
jgi:serine/threonine protein kinase